MFQIEESDSVGDALEKLEGRQENQLRDCYSLDSNDSGAELG